MVVGATGTGKSELSLDLAEAFAARGTAAEIVNADAMQLYRGMDIGTAKLPQADRRGIPHHLLDVLDVSDESSVADYQVRARKAIADIVQRGARPILVGGSGLYVSSVIYDFQFPGTDHEVRARLEAELLEVGTEVLYRRLLDSDEAAAVAIGPRNGRRIVRALEVIEITGAPFGSGLPDESSYWMPTTVIGLSAPRPRLVERLDERVIRMWQAGLLAEVESLGDRLEHGITASRAIGYSTAIAQLRGRMSEADAIAETQATTRRYARRQVGWFRRYPATRWFDFDRDDLLGAVLEGIDAVEHASGTVYSPNIDA